MCLRTALPYSSSSFSSSSSAWQTIRGDFVKSPCMGTMLLAGEIYEQSPTSAISICVYMCVSRSVFCG